MEKEELLKKIDDIGKKTNPIFVKGVKEAMQEGDYKQASLSLYAVSEFKDCPAEAREVAKEIGDFYVSLRLKEVREKAATDRVAAKRSLSKLEHDIKGLEMDVPPEYEETRKFLYGLAPEQNEADEKVMDEIAYKENQDHFNKSVRDAKGMVRYGELLDCEPEAIESVLDTAKIAHEKLGYALPPDYPENGDWENAWKNEARAYVDECVELARELSGTDDGKNAAKQSLGYAKYYASRFGLELPPGYRELEERFGGVKEYEHVGRTDIQSLEEKPGETAEEAEARNDLRKKAVWRAKLVFARGDISALRSSDKPTDKDIKGAIITLRNFKVTSKVDGRPLPPEYYVLKKLAGWKDPDEEPPAELKDKRYYEDESKSLEELKEHKSGRYWKKRGHAGAEKEDDMEKIRLGVEKYTSVLQSMSDPGFVRGTSDVYILRAARAHLDWAKSYERAFGKSMPSGYGEFEKLLEETEAKFGTEGEESASVKPVKGVNRPHAMTHDESYGLRKELESSGHPRHMEALNELRSAHYVNAARLIDMAEKSDDMHLPPELLRPLYEEAVRDLLNRALDALDDHALLQSRIMDADVYISRLPGLPEDLAAIYREICKKAGC